MDGLKVNPNLRVYQHECECGNVEELTTIPGHGKTDRPCKCGKTLKFRKLKPSGPVVVNSSPAINFNHWKTDKRVIDGERERIEAGFYE